MFGFYCRLFYLAIAAAALLLESSQTASGGKHCSRSQISELERQLFQKAFYFYQQKKWQLAHAFFFQAWEMYNASAYEPHGIELVQVVYGAQLSASHLGNYEEAKSLCEWGLANLRLSGEKAETFLKAVNFYTFKLAVKQLENIKTLPKWKQLSVAKDLASYFQYDLCNEDVAMQRLKKLAEDPTLFCRYHNRGKNPLLLLAPVKEEIYSLDPLVILMHDIMLKSEIKQLKELALPFLTSGTVRYPHQKIVEVEQRKSEIAWIEDEQLKSLAKRVEAYTNLQIGNDGSEPLQVCRYGIGGHYIPHLDAYQEAADPAVGDRLATLLLYGSQLIKGGGTVFNKLKLHVVPKRGAGLFWYNLHRNESANFATFHAGCPVIQGEKWIVNKWFYTRGQFRHRPCGKTKKNDFSLENFDELPNSFL